MVDAATGGGPQHGRDIDQLDKDIRQANQPATLASVTPATASSQMLSARGTQAARSYRRTEQATANPGPKFPYIDSSGGPGCQWRRVMSNDPSPLKYMGTQSQESVAMEAAMAAALVDDAAGTAENAGSRLGDAASWAVDKAKDVAQATAHQIGKRTTKAVESYTRDDPVRAILIAAGTGALLMVLVALVARSGARSVTRRLGG